jgi:hypothetical protein
MHIEDINRLKVHNKDEQQQIEAEQSTLLKEVNALIRRYTLTPCTRMNNKLRQLISLLRDG